MVLLRCFASCCITSFIFGWLAYRVEARSHDEEELKSLYIVTHVVSDASPFWYEYILDVKPQGKDVLVREIRIAPLDSGCPSHVTVKAADHLLTRTSPKRVARLDLCSLNVGALASVIRGAQAKGISSIDDTASYSIVAMCGRTEKIFEIPYPETVELRKLRKTNPQVASLWDLAYDIRLRSFGRSFSFYNASAAQNKAFQALGAETVPAIKSGIYGRGFQDGSHLQPLLNEESGVANELDDVWQVEFVEPVSADLTEYRLPMYPPLARQTRTEGEVHLVAVLDPNSGLVKDVKVTSGHPLLSDAAVAAVRGWHFQEGNTHKDSVEVVLRFVLRCPSP
jgi:TonB family protein